MKRLFIATLCLFAVRTLPAQADLVGNVMTNTYGYTVIADEVGSSGLTSSYHGLALSNPAFNAMPALGPGHVSYPSGVGMVPSPGGNTGRPFDQGALGYKISGGNITFGLATGLNPTSWTTVNGTKYGQGDLFLEVLGGGQGMSHFALLNNINNGASVGQSLFNASQTFRSGAGPSVGELVKLNADGDVQLTGGAAAYVRGSNSPAGLDERLFAKGGTDMNVGTLQLASFTAAQPLGNGTAMTWYLMQWTVPISIFGEGPLQIALHSTASCGNDQIAGLITLSATRIPSPGAAVLGLIGMGLVGRTRSRKTA